MSSHFTPTPGERVLLRGTPPMVRERSAFPTKTSTITPRTRPHLTVVRPCDVPSPCHAPSHFKRVTSSAPDSLTEAQPGDPRNLQAVRVRINQFTPDLPADQWATIAPFVREAVADCGSEVPYQSRDLLTVCSHYVNWCVTIADIPLDRADTFDPFNIERYTHSALRSLKPATRTNHRAKLRRMSELLMPVGSRPSRMAPLDHSDAVSPYTDAEVIALRNWANALLTDTQQRDTNTVLALGIGAGLSAGEITRLTYRDLTADDHGVLVNVTYRHPRVIPVTADWEDWLIQLSTLAPLDKDAFVFRARRTKKARNTYSNFAAKLHPGSAPRLNSQRARATWIINHLRRGIPVKPLMQAAGVDSLEAFTRYVQFLPQPQQDEYRSILRAGIRKRDRS